MNNSTRPWLSKLTWQAVVTFLICGTFAVTVFTLCGVPGFPGGNENLWEIVASSPFLGPSLARSREAHFACPNRRACSQATCWPSDPHLVVAWVRSLGSPNVLHRSCPKRSCNGGYTGCHVFPIIPGLWHVAKSLDTKKCQILSHCIWRGPCVSWSWGISWIPLLLPSGDKLGAGQVC